MNTNTTATAPANTTAMTVPHVRSGDWIHTDHGWVEVAHAGVAGGQHEMVGTDGRLYRASQFRPMTVRRPNA